jgi:hypothetical protein
VAITLLVTGRRFWTSPAPVAARESAVRGHAVTVSGAIRSVIAAAEVTDR